jgi:hypothetical protein
MFSSRLRIFAPKCPLLSPLADLIRHEEPSRAFTAFPDAMLPSQALGSSRAKWVPPKRARLYFQ